MIKGHAKIELKDEVTGEVKTVEQDNMVTNALAELAKPFCGRNGLYTHLYKESPYSVVETLFGGVMLFEEPLNSDPDDYIWPFANPCTGFASNFAYSGVNTKLGGYNLAESGLQEDGSYKHVWDFATDSGNGTISSLGLTSTYSAKIGLGSLMYDFGVSAPQYIFFENGSDSSIRSYINPFKPLFIKDGFLYSVPLYTFTGTDRVYNNGGIFTILKTRVPIGTVGLKTAYYTFNSDKIEIQLPSDFVSQFTITSGSSYSMSVEYKDGIITLAYSDSSVSAAATMKLCHINCNDNFSTYTTTFTNTTGETIADGFFNYRSRFKPMYDYCLAIGNASHNIYVINTNDCTDIKRVQLLNGENIALSSSTFLLGTVCTDATTAVVLIGGANTSATVNYALFINLKTGQASYGNMKESINHSSGVVAVDENGLLGCGLSTTAYSSMYEFINFINPFFLTTKNNLSTPVTKTATQSMKITYTLREG